jgi:Ppx/GppA phosphatase family
VLGVDIHVLPHEEEAKLSLLCTVDVLQRLGGAERIRDDEQILLIDQGGGSLELAWMSWRDRDLRNPPIQQKRYEELGTVTLRRRFFEMSSDGSLVNPRENRARVSNQMQSVNNAARATILNIMGLPKPPAPGEYTVHAFGLGTAVTKVWPDTGNWRIHGRQLTYDLIDQTLAERLNFMELNNQQVLSVYKAVYGLRV